MTFSEFGRRAKENGSNGTDHGTSLPQFLIGGQVSGGLYGTYPSLTDLDPTGNLQFDIDYRQVYASVLEDWLGVDSRSVLGAAVEQGLGLQVALARPVDGMDAGRRYAIVTVAVVLTLLVLVSAVSLQAPSSTSSVSSTSSGLSSTLSSISPASSSGSSAAPSSSVSGSTSTLTLSRT